MRSTMSSWRIWCAERLIATRIRRPLSRQARLCRQASSITQLPSWPIRPKRSAIGMKTLGHQHAAGRVLPAQQRLDRRDLAALGIDLRLVEQLELLGRDRLAQVAQQRRTGPRRRRPSPSSRSSGWSRRRAWRSTSRRRRGRSAWRGCSRPGTWRCRPSTRSSTSRPSTAYGCDRPWIRRVGDLGHRLLGRTLVSSSRNSSPPTRATTSLPRDIAFSRWPTCSRTRSPIEWP